jgi:hypothetical protein
VNDGNAVDKETAKLTIRLPRGDLDFARAYARAHGLSVTELIARYLRRLRALEQHVPAPELDAITGLVPREVGAEAEYRRGLAEKHGR